MARKAKIASGSWLLAEDLLEQGDPGFVDELRRINQADRLKRFAKTWYADRRRQARQFLLDYFDYPLNAYRHEGLVKAIFKLAEAAGDDQLMGRMMVALDRTVRREKVERHRYDWSTGDSWTDESVQVPTDTVMPRQDRAFRFRDPDSATLWAAPTKEFQQRLRLYSIATRNYLRRRAWRYFRRIGKLDPDRYLAAIASAIIHYTDDDVADGLALLDNWGLMHVLFHHSDQIVAQPRGWMLSERGSLGSLQAAPAFEQAWKKSAEPLLAILDDARCRPVRQWAIDLLRKYHAEAVDKLPAERLLKWIGSGDRELARLAADALGRCDQLAAIPAASWLRLIDQSDSESIEVICELLTNKLDPARLTLTQAVGLAAARPIPVARLGLRCLTAKRPQSRQECESLLALAEAEADPIREQLVVWVRETLADSPHFQPAWIIQLLDSRHREVREVGWDWLLANETARDDIRCWQQVLESPYDDVRFHLLDVLEQHQRFQRRPLLAKPERLPAELLRSLWAAVLLNVHRGGRKKPGVVQEIVDRLASHPEEADQLLPLLAVALRSVRSVEWRSGLSGVVTLVDRHPELATAVQKSFPELVVS
jgi:hypothetical protein